MRSENVGTVLLSVIKEIILMVSLILNIKRHIFYEQIISHEKQSAQHPPYCELHGKSHVTVTGHARATGTLLRELKCSGFPSYTVVESLSN